MSTPLRVLIVEDSEDDATLLLRELRRGDYDVSFERVDTPAGLESALDSQNWDVVISDYVMPQFSGLNALKLLREKDPDLPFIIVSGAIGEAIAVEAMKAGAHDYLMKGNLARLSPAIEREMREAVVRRQRRLAEENLRESEERFRQLVERAADALFLNDMDLRIIDVNQQACESLGYTREELLSLSQPDIEVQFSPEAFQKLCEQIASSGPATVYGVHRRKDGSTFPVEVRVGPFEYRGRQLTLALTRDITERKRAEEALREAEARFRNLVESSSDWVWEVDENAVYTYASPRIRDLLGYEPEEVVGKTVYDLMSPNEAERVARVFGEIAARQAPFFLLENTLTHRDGRQVIVETSGVPVFDEEGNFRGYRGVDRDVTERKQAEEDKRRLQEEADEAKRKFYSETILAVTEGKLEICEPEEMKQWVCDPERVALFSKPEDAVDARRVAREFFEEHGVECEELDMCLLCVGEAVTNALKHAAGGELLLGVRDEQLLWVAVVDEGPGIDALTLPRATLMPGFSTKPSLGMGYTIILTHADKVRLSTGPTGTTVFMERCPTAGERTAKASLDRVPDMF